MFELNSYRSRRPDPKTSNYRHFPATFDSTVLRSRSSIALSSTSLRLLRVVRRYQFDVTDTLGMTVFVKFLVLTKTLLETCTSTQNIGGDGATTSAKCRCGLRHPCL